MTGGSNNMPFIKSEPDEFNTSNSFLDADSNFGMSQFNNQTHNSVNPSDLSMDNNNNNFGMQYGYGSQHMSGSFHAGKSGFAEDELLESLNFSNGHSGMDDFSTIPHHGNNGLQNGSNPMNVQGQVSGMYSNTPDGHPIQSPFLNNNFDFNSPYRPMGMNSVPTTMSPHHAAQMMSKRPSLQSAQRKSSDARSPMTPRTAAMAKLHIGSPDPMSLPTGRPINAQGMRHQKSLSGQWDGTPGSLHSTYLDSPLSSPGHALQHATIADAMASAKHASLPAKVENAPNSTAAESAEIKKRRRRASHNAVERRRRDNINERIQDLSHLVPQHRLEDDKVRKQLANQGPMSPTLAGTNMSPPNAATSLLAGANGRRATSAAGNITLGLPIEEKEKGPNKGDILNGSVSWTRDLMWALHQKFVQEEELAQYVTSLGGTWPFQISEDEKRMRTELMDAMDKNDLSTFAYSRADGTGLRVPKHTTLSGERLQSHSSSSPPSNFELSPGFHSGGSGANSGSNGAGQPTYWQSAGHAGISFKEEDEYSMDMQ